MRKTKKSMKDCGGSTTYEYNAVNAKTVWSHAQGDDHEHKEIIAKTVERKAKEYL